MRTDENAIKYIIECLNDDVYKEQLIQAFNRFTDGIVDDLDYELERVFASNDLPGIGGSTYWIDNYIEMNVSVD